MAHLSEESLTLLALGEALDPQSREHVASCADCTAELASLQRVVHAGRAEAPGASRRDGDGWVLKGRKISDTPVIVDTAPTLYINMNSVQKLGVQVPVEMLGSANLIQ